MEEVILRFIIKHSRVITTLIQIFFGGAALTLLVFCIRDEIKNSTLFRFKDKN